MGTENKKGLVIRYSPNFAVGIIDSKSRLIRLVDRLQAMARREIDPKLKLKAEVIDGALIIKENEN